MNVPRLVLFLSCTLLIGACNEQPAGAVGLLVSDRIELTAEVAEPVTAIHVVEGSRVAAGEELVSLDDARVSARILEVEAEIGRLQALLSEQVQGPRPEVIEAARARVEERRVDYEFRTRDLARLSGLQARNLTSEESVDQARRSMEVANASLMAASAQLRELEAGTRVEQLEQTRYSLQQAQARLQQLQIDRQRLTMRAPVAGLVDSIPFETGERPPPGAVVAVLLAGTQPHARVYLPEPYRTGVSVGDPVRVVVDGLTGSLDGTVRWVSSDPAFTPYFALTERDRSRLSYLTEVTLPDSSERLPDGVPVDSFFTSMDVPDER